LEEARVDIFEDADPGLLASYHKLQVEISSRAREALSGSQKADIPDELKYKLEQLRNTRRDLIGKSKRARDLVAPPLPSLEQIQKDILDDQTVLLEYWLGDEHSTLWVITRTEFHPLKLDWSGGKIETAVYDWLSRLNREAAAVRSDPDARELSRQLLGPAQAWLGGKRILIVPYGVLNRVPFAALPDPAYSTKGPVPFLLERHELVYAPSVSALKEIRKWRRERGSGGKGIALVVDPVYRSDDSRLKGSAHPSTDQPAAEAEALGLKGCTGLTRALGTTQVLTNARQPEFRAFGRQFPESGFKASVANVKGDDLRNVQVVHFGAHACVSPANPELSALALSQWDENGRRVADSFLHVKDVYDLKWKADLVVLAACETALGKETPSGGVDGLARAFHYAGAPSVIASLWDAGDADTGYLMGRFYDALGAHGGIWPAAALRAAQLKLIDSSPHAWAAFVLQGEWVPPAPGPREKQ
jgi:CHAT domain-containing protein